MQATAMITDTYDSVAVSAPVEYRILRPADWSSDESLPLVLHLHGAMSSAASLDLARPFYDQAWAEGTLPRAVVASPSTPPIDGFYLNWPTARWETLVAEEFGAHLAGLYGEPTAIALMGSSMGGYGVLKLAFTEPERFAAVAAISPAVFPGELPDTVPDHALPSVLGDLHRSMSLNTGDPATYVANSVQGRARANAEAVRQSELAILIDCGAVDEFLHGVLAELGIRHDFRLIPGAGHLGPEAELRTAAAIGFLGAALS